MVNNEVEDFKIELDVDEVIKNSVPILINYLKISSPKNTGTYSSSWTFKKEGKKYIVYNSTGGSLTHLLENGHLTKNRKRRVAPQPHIRPSYERFVPKYMAKMEKIKPKIK